MKLFVMEIDDGTEDTVGKVHATCPTAKVAHHVSDSNSAIVWLIRLHDRRCHGNWDRHAQAPQALGGACGACGACDGDMWNGGTIWNHYSI